MIKELDRLKLELESYKPTFNKESSFSLSSLWKQKDEKRYVTNAPCGLYIYGAVGGGKSMLMDLFFDCTDINLKTRIHFHDFMQKFHRGEVLNF